jgi:serine/threonine protein kinase
MGGKGSKGKKNAKEDEPEAKSSPSLRKDDKTKSLDSTAPIKESSEAKEDGDEMHESWNDQTLFSQNNAKVTKDDFELLTVIGKGSFGKVMQVKKKDDGKIYAMKVLRKEAIIQRKQVAHTQAEKSILQKIQHPFIVKLHYAFQTKDKLYMILDYINGGELFHHLKKEGRFPENRVKFYSAEIVCAMSHLHSLGIVYRDLKPENILIDSEGHICITDFGLSKEIKPDEGTHTFCGTPEYLAPEVLKGQGHGIAVDWWSLGTLIYEMLTGLPPFYSQNINIMYQKILNGELRFPSYVSGDAQSLLEGLLTRDVEKRLGSQPGEVKKHPFFKEIDWEKLERREIEAPYKPKVKNEMDTTQIDPVFTGEKPQDSLVESGLSETVQNENNFKGFTFVSPTAMDGGEGVKSN